MLRFIVYRYISYKDSKISHASLPTLRHHLSQPPSPTPYPCPTPPSSTTHLTAPPPAHDLLHPALLPVPALPHPALRHTSLPYHQHLPYSTLLYDLYLPYSTQPYYRPHCITTYTRPTPLLSYLSQIRQPYLCAHYCLSTTALSPATHTIPYTAHTCHTPHHPAHLPHRCTMPPPYLIGSTTQPYLGHLYPPFSSATFIGLIRPIGLIGPTPTRARTGQVVGVIGLIGAISLIPP